MATDYASQVTRTYEFVEFWHAMGSTYVEFEITFHYPDAEPETQRVRISHSVRDVGGTRYDGWWLRIMASPDEVRHLVPINPEVTSRLQSHLADGALTEAWVRAFYGD
jgi:hypothetical protein